MRALGKKPHVWPSQKLKKVLLTAQGCALAKKIPFVQKFKEGAICAILREKTPFLAFPEAKKGVVSCARLRKAAHWPNNNANPLGLSEKKVYCVEKRDMCEP